MAGVPRWVAAPVMRAWVASKSGEFDRLPRPRDAAESHSMGVDSDRALIVGGDPAVGWGVLSHELALPGALSRALTRRTGRGTDVYVVAFPRLTIGAALVELTRMKWDRYDAVLVTIGVKDAGILTPLASWRRDLIRGMGIISRSCSPRALVFVAGVHPLSSIPVYDGPLSSVAEAHARKMNSISSLACDQLPRTTFVPLSAPEPCSPFRFRDARSYNHWAEELAGSMAPQLDAERLADGDSRELRGGEGDAGSLDERAAAVRQISIRIEERRRRVDHVIARACASFGVKSATVSVIDSERVVHKAQIGDVPEGILLSRSFTATVIRRRDGMIVSDATLDARFRTLPHVAGEPRIHFYAGFALESPQGTRIGTLNIFDPSPRPSENSWRLLQLRQFGLLVQAELRKAG